MSGYDAPHQVNSFAESGLRTLLMQNIERSGYKKPTPVQKYAMPIITKGRDLMGCAQTGSGKTAAFLLPLLHNLLEQGFETRSEQLPQLPEAVIIAPTRELVIQIKGTGRSVTSGTSSIYRGRGCKLNIARAIDDMLFIFSCLIYLLDQSRKFANNSPLKSVCVYGGTSIPHQINQLKRGVNILVATPGRLLDFLDKGYISFR